MLNKPKIFFFPQTQLKDDISLILPELTVSNYVFARQEFITFLSVLLDKKAELAEQSTSTGFKPTTT